MRYVTQHGAAEWTQLVAHRLRDLGCSEEHVRDYTEGGGVTSVFSSFEANKLQCQEAKRVAAAHSEVEDSVTDA